MQALILAGGEGNRMSRVTTHVPKALLYLPGGTVLEHQLALLRPLPISRTFVVVHHRAEHIETALQGRQRVTMVDQRPPFTLLGALASAEGQATEPVLVLHGDNYFSRSLGYLVREAQSADCTFLVDAQTEQVPQARRMASTGCYVLSPEIFPIVERNRGADELSHLTSVLLERGVLVKEVPLRGWRVNINNLDDLLTVSQRILDRWSQVSHPPGAAAGYNPFEDCRGVEPPVWISEQSQVVDSRLGP